MLVWGGGTESVGGRYDPAADRWELMSATGAPPADNDPLVVWTSDELVAWNASLRQGARYNPLSDSWAPMSSDAAPSSRRTELGFWTGKELIVWAGYLPGSPSGTDLNTGGRYNPALNVWRTTTTVSAPSARGQLSGVWARHEMIAWGGVSVLAGVVNTGGRYCPDTAAGSGPYVSNVRARQLADGTNRVEVLFDLTGAPTEGAAIGLVLSPNSGADWTIAPLSQDVSGPTTSVLDGPAKRLLWNAAATLAPETFSNSFVARIIPEEGVSGQSGNFSVDLRSGTYVEISPIASPQAAGVPFPVTLTVKHGGQTVGWAGMLVLDAPPSSSPGSVTLVDGTATRDIVLDSPGTNLVLSASGALGGASNAFDVLPGAGECAGSTVNATVKEWNGLAATGATVHLGESLSCVTGMTGQCAISGVPPGDFEVWASAAERESVRKEYRVACNPITVALRLPGSSCNPSGLTPVLFLPGVMGSTTGCALVDPFPQLTLSPPSEDDWCEWPDLVSFRGLVDPLYYPTGWRNLYAALQSVDSDYELDCTVFPTPYDWRLPPVVAAADYLEPMIAHAKERAGTDRVHIVAHSMGGLVARAYIRGGGFPQPSDIDRLAIVGTPNHGAPLAYLLWEGSDPVLADAASESSTGAGFLGVLDFYRRTTSNLYHTTFGISGGFLPENRAEYWLFRTRYRRKMANLLRGFVPSARALLPSSNSDFLRGPSALLRGLTVPGNVNLELDYLNADTSRLTEPSDPDPNRVRTQLFAGEGVDTLNRFEVFEDAPSSASEFFQDGRPRIDAAGVSLSPWTWVAIEPADYGKAAGDGTVPLASTALPGFSPLTTGSGQHAELVDVYVNDVVTFLTGLTPIAERAGAVTLVQPHLGINVKGRAQPLLLSPGALRTGVEPGTGALLEEIPSSSLDLAVDRAGVAVESPTNGTYTVALAGAYVGEFEVDLAYRDDSARVSNSWMGYFDGATPFTFTFSLDSSAPEPLAVALTPPPPADLVASFSSGLTDLSWASSPDPLVVAYAVYSKLEGEAKLTPLGTTANASFPSGHEWVSAEGVQPRIYAVAARYADGHEGFLSKLAKNDDRDHDGMVDAEELRRGTAVDDADTDGDDLTDGVEDGFGTDIFSADSDSDGFTDGEEVAAGSNPMNRCSKPGIFQDDFELGSANCWSLTVI